MDKDEKKKMTDKVFRWIKLNTDVDGIDFEEFLKVLKKAIDKKIA